MVLVVLLADKNKSFCVLSVATLTKMNLSYIITIRLHCPDANTSLFEDEKEKEMDP